MNAHMVRPSWDQFLTLWIKVIRGWEEHPTPTLPAGEISVLVHALQSMKDYMVLQHPRVAVCNTRSSPKLYVPARKRKKKFENAEAVAAQFEATIQTYRAQGWDIIYPDGSSQKHPEWGWLGGYTVFFGDHRDTAEYIPLGKEQTNNRGELRAALCSVQGHREGHRSLICPNSLLVVNGVLGWAQLWRRHGWQSKSGAVAHVDLWTRILHLVEKRGRGHNVASCPLPHRHKRQRSGGPLGGCKKAPLPRAFWAHLHPPPPPHTHCAAVQQCKTLNYVVMTMRL